MSQRQLRNELNRMNRRNPMYGVELTRALDLIAKTAYDGHFTIFAFTSNYRVMLGTPYSREDIDNAPSGETLEIAVKNCVEQYAASHAPNSARYNKLRDQAEYDDVMIPFINDLKNGM